MVAVQREKDKLTQEVSSLRKHVSFKCIERSKLSPVLLCSHFSLLYLQLRCREAELQSSQSRLSVVESDLHAMEQEKENLMKKVVVLERALESPGSKVALQRILERCLVHVCSCACMCLYIHTYWCVAH